jgi:UDP-N-acetylglucosamine 2-epimerase (hydrolysing)
MRHADVILGNSSSGVREAPVLGTPSVNVGTRQRRRSTALSVRNVVPARDAIVVALAEARAAGRQPSDTGFGKPGAGKHIMALLGGDEIWTIPLYKEFVDRTCAEGSELDW